MNKQVYLFLGLFLTAAGLHAQRLVPLGYGFSQSCVAIFGDTTTNILYTGGSFHLADFTTATPRGKIVNGIAQWNGSGHWLPVGIGTDSIPNDTAHAVNIGVNPVYSILNYQGSIIAAGSFGNAGGVANTKGLSRWDGQHWHNIGSGVGGAGARILNNKLYPTCGFDYTQNSPLYDSLIYNQDALRTIVKSLPVFDGQHWGFTAGPLIHVQGDFADIWDIAIYKGNLYIAGNISLNYGTGNDIEDIARWDSTQQQWVKVGAGLAASSLIIYALHVYKGELYAGGYFLQSDGAPSNCIMKWNDTTWSAVGPGFDNEVFDLVDYHNDLYAIGQFTGTPGVPGTASVARWDGQKWYSLGFDNITESYISNQNGNGGFNRACVFKDTLYFSGEFDMTRGIPPQDYSNGVVKYIPPANGIANIKNNTLPFQVYPNPAKDVLTLTLPDAGGVLQVSNVMGQQLYRAIATGSSLQINVADFPQGVYLLQYTGKGQVVTQKVVKE